MGKSTISMEMFNSYVSHYQRVKMLLLEQVLYYCGKTQLFELSHWPTIIWICEPQTGEKP